MVTRRVQRRQIVPGGRDGRRPRRGLVSRMRRSTWIGFGGSAASISWAPACDVEVVNDRRIRAVADGDLGVAGMVGVISRSRTVAGRGGWQRACGRALGLFCCVAPDATMMGGVERMIGGGWCWFAELGIAD